MSHINPLIAQVEKIFPRLLDFHFQISASNPSAAASALSSDSGERKVDKTAKAQAAGNPDINKKKSHQE